ncbi:glycosyltransferase family 2 protein [Aestuariivivens sediminis]|uniref:glycosyltransferase family 2 protein n=1 Tax=Aestuariivivens sediminis TaxID=2913557 RepID=UPI001F55FC3E|nr:glycosyltransferase family 2 protein [Aestuariivivens sediminis]
MEVIIIIVTFNGMKWIKRCLESCNDFYVIVVDNASSDNTTTFIKRHFSNVMLIENKKNLGFGKANNIGMSKALTMGAKRVFLLNQDAYIVPGSLQKLINVQKSKKDYGVLSPIHLTGIGNTYDRQFFHWMTIYDDSKLKGDTDLDDNGGILNMPFVNAAAWLIHKECIETVGGFDPIFFQYGEDDNYCQRVLFHGYKIGIYKKAFIKHDRNNTNNKSISLNSKEYWLWYERRLKKKYADINGKGVVALNQFFFKKMQETLGHVIYFRFNKIKICLKELFIIVKNHKGISKSYRLNIIRGKMLYLNIAKV